MQIQSRGGEEGGLDPPSKIASTRLSIKKRKKKKEKKKKKERIGFLRPVTHLRSTMAATMIGAWHVGGSRQCFLDKGEKRGCSPRLTRDRSGGSVLDPDLRPPINNAPLCATPPILSRESVHVEADVDRPGFRSARSSIRQTVDPLPRAVLRGKRSGDACHKRPGGGEGWWSVIFDGLDWETLRILSTKDLRKLEEKEK